jgi:hypothetical protein
MEKPTVVDITYIDLTNRPLDKKYNILAADIENSLFEGDEEGVLLKYIKECKDTTTLQFKIACALFNVVSAYGDSNLFTLTLSKTIQYYGLFTIHDFIKTNCPSLMESEDDKKE